MCPGHFSNLTNQSTCPAEVRKRWREKLGSLSGDIPLPGSTEGTCAQLCLILVDPMDCSPLRSFVHGILHQEFWSGLPFSAPGDLLDPGVEPSSLMYPALVGRFFTTEPPGKPETQREGNKPPQIPNILLRNSLGTPGYRIILKSLCILIQIWEENVLTFFIFFITYKNKILCIYVLRFLTKTHTFICSLPQLRMLLSH